MIGKGWDIPIKKRRRIFMLENIINLNMIRMRTVINEKPKTLDDLEKQIKNFKKYKQITESQIF